MRDEYDFSDAVKHPLAGTFKGKYTVTIHYDFNGRDDEAGQGEANVRETVPDAMSGQQTATQG